MDVPDDLIVLKEQIMQLIQLCNDPLTLDLIIRVLLNL